MEKLKLAQYCKLEDNTKEKKKKILMEISTNYSVPDKDVHIHEEKNNYLGYTSLHFVVKAEDLNLVEWLIKKGSNVLQKGTKDGCTPIHVAYKNSFCLDPHIEQQPASKNLINRLLSRQVEINSICNPKNTSGVSHLHIACAINHAEAVELLAKYKQNLHECINFNAHKLPGYTPLHCAIEYSSIKALQILLQHGADINIENANGMSSINFLVDRCMKTKNLITTGNHELRISYKEKLEATLSMIEIVLDARTSNGIFTENTAGLSALHLACILSDKAKVEDFVNQHSDINVQVKRECKFWPGWTPLHFAACFNVETVMLLMKRGADIKIKNARGETALDLCTKRFPPYDIQAILSKQNEFKNIVLSDNCTRLLDLLILIDHCEQFSEFLETLKNRNISVPLDSPIWPGNNLLHMAVSLNERKSLHDDLNHCNFTEDKKIGYINQVKLLLKYGCSTNSKNRNGETPIHLAFRTFSQDVTNILLRHNTDNAIDQNGLSHLHIACAVGDLSIVEKLVRGGADVNGRTRVAYNYHDKRLGQVEIRANSTPLHVAVLFQNKKPIPYLLANNADVCATDSLCFTPIHLSMLAYNSNLTHMLLAAPTASSQESVSAFGLSHLHVAAWADDHQAVERLLLGGAEIDRRRCSLVQVLLNHGADVTIVSSGSTPLCRLYQSIRADTYSYPSDDDVEKVLLLHAADSLLNSQKSYSVNPVDGRGFSHFHFACVRNDVKTASKFLDGGVNVNQSTDPFDDRSGGSTPLHLAMAYKSAEVACLLMKRGADVNAEDSDGNTPLHVAFANRFINFPLIEDLIRRKANVRAKNLWDTTLLHSLMSFENLPTEQYLNVIERTNITDCLYERDENDDTPLHVAINKGNIAAVEGLFSIGINLNDLDIESKFSKRVINEQTRRDVINAIKATARHIWKMKFFRLDLIDSNERFLKSMKKQISDSLVKKLCHNESVGSEETKIYQDMTVKGFLSELGAITEYPMMNPLRQKIINKYFNRTVDLYRQFPELCGLMTLQHNKALLRLTLMEPAKMAISIIFDIGRICAMKLYYDT